MDAFVENITSYISNTNPTTWVFILVILISIAMLRRSRR